MNFQAEKKIILNFYKSFQNCKYDEIPSVISNYYSEDILWRGFHPFNEKKGTKELSSEFWQPLRKSFVNLQRRMDIFLGGINTLSPNKDIWIVSMGHLMGLFDNPWIGIKPTKKITMLRYCEFSKIDNDKISEVAMFFDIPHLMLQAGIKPFPTETGVSLVQPGPLLNNGLLFKKQGVTKGLKTTKIIEKMIKDVLVWKNFDRDKIIKELKKSWNEDMIWWGPTGIGSTFTIERYVDQHVQPFREIFIDRTLNKHICRLAEGNFGGFFGWPNLTLTPVKKFMGINTKQEPSEMRVIDIYRRDGDKLSENWVFIDFLHFWKLQGIDILNEL